MDLPDDIENKIADYLAREFGEHGAGRIRAADLRPLGERVIDGVPMRVWSFPSINGEMWATVQPLGESYCIGMTSPPRAEAGGERYRLRIETEGRGSPLSVDLEPLDAGLYGTVSDVGFTAPNGQSFLISAEVARVDGVDDLTLSILADDEVVLGIRARPPCVIAWSGCLVRVGREE
ncbi:MAG: hypothetical protein MUC79_07065 [Thiobacillaceae bacterium]|jgi:hypothetical protein|nr:hypothetical protein [Thiobacillaceae bacterium]